MCRKGLPCEDRSIPRARLGFLQPKPSSLAKCAREDLRRLNKCAPFQASLRDAAPEFPGYPALKRAPLSDSLWEMPGSAPSLMLSVRSIHTQVR